MKAFFYTLGILTGFCGTAFAAYQIANHSVTQVKLATRVFSNTGTVGAGGVVGVPISSFGTNSGSQVTVTGSSVTLTTTGRPVMLMVVGNGTPVCSIFAGGTNGPGLQHLYFIRTGVLTVAGYLFGINTTTTISNSVMDFPGAQAIDFPPAGTVSYNLAMSTDGSTGASAGMANCAFVAYEI